MTFTRDDRTLLGLTPEEAARKLAELDVDVIGVNCSTGPANVLRLVAMMHEAVPERPLSAAPNAGWPEQVEGGRVMYPATPAYFGEYARSFVEAGARIVGGCCGTTAAHIQAMRAALDNPLAVKRPLPTIQIAERGEDEGTAVTVKPTQMAQDLAAGKFIVTVEMSPPRGIATERLLAGAQNAQRSRRDHAQSGRQPVGADAHERLGGGLSRPAKRGRGDGAALSHTRP